VPAAGAPRPAPRWRRLAIVAAVVVAAVAGAWAWKTFRQVPAPPVAESGSGAAPQPAAPPVIMARPPPEAATPAIVPGTEDVASLDDLTDEPVLEAEAPPIAPVPAVPPPQGQPLSKPDPSTEIRSTPLEPPPQTSTTAGAPKPAPNAPATAATPAPVPAEIPPALTVPAPLRKFREMPPDYRADFPALKIEIHVYEKSPQQRFVMVNGRRYREGERLGEGPVLVEIVPEGLVLEYRGEKVLYTLGR
jgi:general secretion pathway protein B